MTPEQHYQLQQHFRQLSKEEQQKLLEMLYSSINGGQLQSNFDNARGFQVSVNGGQAFIGDINIHVNTSDLSSDFEEMLQPSFFDDSHEDRSAEFYENSDEFEYESDYTVEDYTNSYVREYSDISWVPILIGILAIFGVGVLIVGAGSETAIVMTPPPLNAANIRDDVGNVKESIPKGTKVRLTGKRDGDYCKTDRGWIYCTYLAKIISESSDRESAKPAQKNSSVKTAIVKPGAGQNAANLRSQPNAGKILGNIPRGQQVQVIQCIADGCEVSNGSIQGWIYKPYLH
jgi:hypothetical protein